MERKKHEDASADAATPELAGPALCAQVDSFRNLYEAIAPSLHAWARLRLRAIPAHSQEVEDLLQEVWLRAIEVAASFDPRQGSFRTWIFGIAKNVAYEAQRSRTRSLTQRAETAPSIAVALRSWPDMATSIRTRLAREESVELLLAELAAMNPLDRMLVVHCGLEGLPCTVAATRLSLGTEAATKRWQRLRARLRARPFASLFAP